MRGLLYISSAALVVAFAFWAYQVNYTTQTAVRRVDDLHQQIAQERLSISMLNAEWAYLNRPDRLRELAEQYFPDLRLMPMTAQHFGDPAMVAYPPSDPSDQMAEDILNAVLEGTR